MKDNRLERALVQETKHQGFSSIGMKTEHLALLSCRAEEVLESLALGLAAPVVLDEVMVEADLAPHGGGGDQGVQLAYSSGPCERHPPLGGGTRCHIV